jgi:hypothetical protein
MARRVSSSVCTLRFAAVPNILVFFILLALVVPAHQLGAGQASTGPARVQGVYGTSATSQAWQRAETPGTLPPKIPLQGLGNRRTASREASPPGVNFQPAATYSSGGYQPAFVAIADVNGDGIPDLLVANSYSSDTIGVLLGNGDGTFKPVVVYSSGGGGPITIIPADLTGNGNIDLIVGNQSPCYACTGDGVVSILFGNGDGTFQSPVTYDSGGFGPDGGAIGPTALAYQDVNGDGKPDIVVVNCAPAGASACSSTNGVVSVLLGNGDGTFQSAIISNAGVLLGGALVVADVNGDGKPDALVTSSYCVSSGNCGWGAIGVMLGNGDGTFQPAVTYDSSAFTALGLAAADLNGDGNLDLVLAGCASSDCLNSDGVVSIFFGNGDGSFQFTDTYDTGGPLADGVAIADLVHDGTLDIVVANVIGSNYSPGSVGVLLGNGDGTFQPGLPYSVANDYIYSVAVEDLNGDGLPDIAAAAVIPNCNCEGQVGVLLSNPAGTTTALSSSLNPSNLGQSVSFTATVTSASFGTLTGTVTFYDGTTQIGSATLANGSASVSTSTLPAGSSSITAAYGGSKDFAASTSSPLIQDVIGLTTATSLSSSVNPAVVDQYITFTAAVTSSYGTPANGEIVTFYKGSAVLGTATLSGGSASLNLLSNVLGMGTFGITASYPGDSTFAPSTSGPLLQTVESKYRIAN